ncbi:hypothetical protein COU75_02735 [Candidatus Peregrinibacteria bacterium CG10_big_fil_rev_8_21_14_0_10_42_8]|nr:MAG: hypothetical protein COU75_02735 [Candidatus Peregrinibacteria bacterium CG10_big_fil_rev_8_21_14_0_10_42_8]
MKNPIEYIRSKKTEIFLQKKWWHRLLKVGFYFGFAWFGLKLLAELADYCSTETIGNQVFETSPLECSGVAGFYVAWWLFCFLLVQIGYYKIFLYIVYGKDIPK